MSRKPKLPDKYEPPKENKEVDLNEAAQQLIDVYHFKTFPGVRSDDIFYWDDYLKIYRAGGEARIKSEAELIFEKCSVHQVRELIAKIARLTYCEREEMQQPPHLIPLINCTLDISVKPYKEMPANPDYFFTSRLPVKYNKLARCDAITKFLDATFEPEYRQLIREWFGFGLYREHFLKRALVLVGQANTGKTTTLQLFFAFFGAQNCCSETLQRLAKNSFALVNLEGRYMNIADELPTADINSTAEFKSYTGGAPQRAERKYQDAYLFRPYAKLTYACNELPKIKEGGDEAFYSRWLFVPCDNVVSQKDPFLLKKLTTEAELSGLLNDALEALQTLLTKYEFSYPNSWQDNRAMMQAASDSLSAFVQACIEINPEGYISKDDFFNTFRHWAAENNREIISKAAVGRMLPQIVSQASASQHNIAGKSRVHCWDGIAFNVTGITAFETPLGRIGNNGNSVLSLVTKGKINPVNPVTITGFTAFNPTLCLNDDNVLTLLKQEPSEQLDLVEFVNRFGQERLDRLMEKGDVFVPAGRRLVKVLK